MKAKSNLSKQILGLVLGLALMLTYVPMTAFAADTMSDDIVILYTNDVHTYIDNPLSYDVIAAIKDDLQKEYKYVILADAGDHIQGTAYGSMDKGESIINLMNAAGYDVATLGNHEFDYNMQGCMSAIGWAKFPYISCNFYREANGVRSENVLDSYVMFDCGSEKVAFVGVTTPETFSKSTPAYFQDENGNFIYGISGGEDGSELQQDVQKAIDEADDAGATLVIALGHLGVDPSSTPWTSEETIAGVSGLDAFIDGHSHTVMESDPVKDKDGNDVLLTQTGEYFNRIGMMVIDAGTGDITTDFIECKETEDGYTLTSDIYNGTELISDTTVKAIKDSWLQEIDEKLGQNIGWTIVTFDNYDSNGNRLVRSQETNSGDFAADALYYLFDDMNLDVDIAIMNGGGVRNQAVTGDISYKTCKDMLPFGNVACLQTVTGQQILDMLEWGARHAGNSEDGSFLHVSGITYKVNTSISNTTQADDMDIWIGGPAEYRVHDVTVYNKDTGNWDALDLNAAYNLAGYNYTLRDLGGGFAMLNGAVNVLDYVMEDYMVLANYIQGFENGIIEAGNSPLLAKYPGLLIDYSDVNGSGRIALTTSEQEGDPEASGVYVGGVRVTEDNADDVLGDADGEAATVMYDAKTNTLTLNGYSYEGEGYQYGSGEDEESGEKEFYSVAIYSTDSLTIKLEGSNILNNSFNDPSKGQYGDGVVTEGGITFIGNGNLSIFGDYAIESDEDVIIDGCTLELNATDDGIIAGNVIVKNGAAVVIRADRDGIVAFDKDAVEGDVSITDGVDLTITADGDGIYADKGVTVTDSTVTIDAGVDGIYAYDGNVVIGSTKTSIYAHGPWLEGTKVTINADGDYGIFAYIGLTIDEKLTVSIPESGSVGELTAKDYTYGTVVAEGTAATDIVIEPLGYTVTISGLSYGMGALVPAGQSLNEAYCEMYRVEDFSQILNTEKDGYTFSGWYTDEACTDGNEYDFDSTVTADVTIYPKWVYVTTGDDGKDDNEPTDNPQIGGDSVNDDSELSDSPQTGGNSNMELWFALLFVSGCCLFGVTLNERKRRMAKKINDAN